MPHPLDWEAQPEWAGLTLGIDHPDEVAELGRCGGRSLAAR